MAHAFRIVRGADAGEASKQYVMTFRRFASRQPSLRGDRLRMRKLCERYASGRVSWRYEQELLQSMLAQPDWAISDDGDAGNRWLGTEEQQEDSGSQYFVLRQTAPGVMEATVLDATCDFTHVNPAPSERGAGGGSSSGDTPPTAPSSPVRSPIGRRMRAGLSGTPGGTPTQRGTPTQCVTRTHGADTPPKPRPHEAESWEPISMC